MKLFSKINNFRGYTLLGLLANCCFVLFIIITMIYYNNFLHTGKVRPWVETIAYSTEVLGFILMAANVVGYMSKLRFRILLKIAMSVYFVAEFAIMIMDLNIIDAGTFYTPASKVVIILHCVFSAFVCMTYISLDTSSNLLQASVIISCIIMLLAVFAIVFNVRLYASVLINCVAYIVLDSMLLFFHKRESITVDCYGDAAKVYEDSTLFSDKK